MDSKYLTSRVRKTTPQGKRLRQHVHIQSNTSHILQELNKIHSLIHTVICAHSSFASVIFFFKLLEETFRKGFV